VDLRAVLAVLARAGASRQAQGAQSTTLAMLATGPTWRARDDAGRDERRRQG
jgi:hypothetical protein